jgi:hypothetical protein
MPRKGRWKGLSQHADNARKRFLRENPPVRIALGFQKFPKAIVLDKPPKSIIDRFKRKRKEARSHMTKCFQVAMHLKEMLHLTGYVRSTRTEDYTPKGCWAEVFSKGEILNLRIGKRSLKEALTQMQAHRSGPDHRVRNALGNKTLIRSDESKALLERRP